MYELFVNFKALKHEYKSKRQSTDKQCIGNTVARSANHFCRGKGISNKCYDSALAFLP
jgi:hypothetical protein